MTTSRKILSVGIDPTLVETNPSSSTAFPDLDHDKIMAAAEKDYAAMRFHGFAIERCIVDLGETAEAVYRRALAENAYDYIVIGAGIRMDPVLSHLFEMLVNVAFELNPTATLVFDTGPGAKADAVLRWHPRSRPVGLIDQPSTR